jgi:ketosteroid isomerase-like protein
VSEENVELVRAAWDAWERGDTDAVFAFYDPEIVWDQAGYGATDFANLYHGHDGVRQFFREWLAPLGAITRTPKISLTPERLSWCIADKAVAESTVA